MKPIDSIALKGKLLSWFENDARDIEMLSICESLIDPRLDDTSIQHVSSASHAHNFSHSVLKAGSVG